MNAPIHANPALYLSPEMVAELALGMDPPYDVAARYGLARHEFDKLQALDWFGEMIAKKRMDYAENGALFTAKARMMAEELYQQLYKTALTGGLTPDRVLDLTKQLTEVGDMKPQKGAVAVGDATPKFQINIQVNGSDVSKAQTRRIDVDEVIEAKPLVSIPLDTSVPPRPSGLTVPDFDMRRDLIGNQAVAQAVNTG